MSAESMMIMGFMVVVACSVALYLGDDGEITHIMAAARTGASEGMIIDSLAIYPNDSFNNYTKYQPRLISPSSVKIVKIDYENKGHNPTYNRTMIMLRIYAAGPHMDSYDQRSYGERINYYARESICEVFKTQNLTDYYKGPSLSNKYVVDTEDVVWV